MKTTKIVLHYTHISQSFFFFIFYFFPLYHSGVLMIFIRPFLLIAKHLVLLQYYYAFPSFFFFLFARFITSFSNLINIFVDSLQDLICFVSRIHYLRTPQSLTDRTFIKTFDQSIFFFHGWFQAAKMYLLFDGVASKSCCSQLSRYFLRLEMLTEFYRFLPAGKFTEIV